MSEVMRKLHIETPYRHSQRQTIVIRLFYKGHAYNIPETVLENYRANHETDEDDFVSADDLFAQLDKKYTKAGALLKGLRNREHLNQSEFAAKINVYQADLSKMETGKRSIGKIVAKRIEKIFGIDYRYFL